MLGNLFKGLPVAISVCDTEGTILAMNDKACKNFEKEGGKELIGKNVMDCHPEKARSMLHDMLKNQTTNCYTVEKDGIKKLIYQTPWFQDGLYMGIAELIIEIPEKMPHFLR